MQQHVVHHPVHHPQQNVMSPQIQRQRPQSIIQQQPVSQPVQNVKQDNKSKVEEELRKCLQKIYDKENEQLNLLASHQKQLENHALTINQIKTKQNEEKELLQQRRQNLQIKIEATEQWLKSNEKKEEIEIDEGVVPSDVLSKQCVDAVAMDFAITDVILELDRCLEDETIKLETYLKQVSKMAREQFAHKALAKAVYEKQNELVLSNQR